MATNVDTVQIAIKVNARQAGRSLERTVGRAQKKVNRQAQKGQDELIRRREKLVVRAIEDETDRRLKAIDTQFNAERRRIDQLLKARLRAGEITEQQFREQQRQFDRLLDRARQTEREAVGGADGILGRFQKLDTALATVGGGLGLGLLADRVRRFGQESIQASIRFESAFAGVRKTVDATEQEFTALERRIRQMSLRLPASAEEIAGVAEAAGQLGVPIGDIEAFTETMIRLGVTTDLSAEQAATALARFITVAGTEGDQIDEIGSTIVALGNNFAATEAEILGLTQRLVGAGSTAGLTEDQVLALGAALANVGVQSELGGTAVSRVLLELQKAAAGTSDSIEVLEQIVPDFARRFEEDAAEALRAFLRVLNQLDEPDALRVLEGLGLEGQRVTDVLLRLSRASDDVDRAFALAAGSIESNNALLQESEERFKTTASQQQLFNNQLEELKRVYGDSAKPSYEGLLALGGGLIEMYTELIEKNKIFDLSNLLTPLAALTRYNLGAASGIANVLGLVGDEAEEAGGQIADMRAELDFQRYLDETDLFAPDFSGLVPAPSVPGAPDDDDETTEQERRERQRKEEQLAQRVEDFRIGLIEDTEARARALIEQRYAEALALARELGDAEAAARLEGLQGEALSQSASQFRDQLLNAADAFSAQLESGDAADELGIEAELKRINDERKEDEEAIADARERGLRIALDLYDQQVARSRQIVRDVFSAIEAAARFESRFSDAEIDLQRDRFAQEEEELRNSLETRAISQEEYHRRMRELAVDRSEFEKEVERDRASFISRSVVNLKNLAIQAALDALKEKAAAWITEQVLFAEKEATKTGTQAAGTAARSALSLQEIAANVASAASAIATAVANAIRWVFTTIPFPLSLAVAGGAAASVIALWRGARNQLGFAEGGYTGRGAREEPAGVVHRDEFVLTKRAVRGRPQPFYRLMAALERGQVAPSDLDAWLRTLGAGYATGASVMASLGLPGFAEGGFADAAVLTPAVPGGTTPPSVDMEPVRQEVRQLRGQVADLVRTLQRERQSPPPVIIGDQDSRKIVETGTSTRRRVRVRGR
ncbi:MAG: phage tail tape measure protein [Bacteroidetes bacterium]|jgi:TP901 family phage tail tape measure protein|nr:phage tail tape measure protein [Bacteroidota bacterium]